jgi:Ca2+-transporting ATPase
MRAEYVERKSKCHSLAVETIASELETSLETGLSGPEARARLDRFGPNRLPEPPRESLLIRF